MRSMSDETASLRHRAMLILALVALTATLAVGVLLRLADPLSSSVVPAEDPYTHMALVRGHLRDGSLDPLFEGGTLYPPGLHAVLAAAWVYTGSDLYDLFRIGPVVLGAIGLLGAATLLWRFAGPAESVVGTLSLAVAPEMIFRTTMMAPTALDLAILPAFLFAALATLRGRLGWGAVVLVLGGFLVTSHPWILAVLGPSMVALAALAVVFPGAWRHVGLPRAAGVATLLLATGSVLLLSLTVCWDQCGLGFQNIDSPTFSATLDQAVAAVATTCVLGGVAVFALQHRLEDLRDRLSGRSMPLLVRVGLSVVLLAILVGSTVPAVRHGMPLHVDLPRMFGWPILALSAAGFVALPFLRSPAGHAGAAVATVTYPFVIYAPFTDPNWPHRTAVFMGVGLVLLAGTAAGAAIRMVHALPHRVAARKDRTAGARRVVVGTTAALLLSTTLIGTVYAATPDDYEGGWYRLYHDCEFDALRALAESVGPDDIIVTGSWEAKLVVAAFAPNGGNVWFHYNYYTQEGLRINKLYPIAYQGREVIVVADRHLDLNSRDPVTGFLQADPWVPIGAWCAGMGLQEPRLSAYRLEVEP